MGRPASAPWGAGGQHPDLAPTTILDRFLELRTPACQPHKPAKSPHSLGMRSRAPRRCGRSPEAVDAGPARPKSAGPGSRVPGKSGLSGRMLRDTYVPQRPRSPYKFPVVRTPASGSTTGGRRKVGTKAQDAPARGAATSQHRPEDGDLFTSENWAVRSFRLSGACREGATAPARSQSHCNGCGVHVRPAAAGEGTVLERAAVAKSIQAAEAAASADARRRQSAVKASAKWRGFAKGRKVTEEWAAEAFATLDQDGDGRLATCELRNGAFSEKIREAFGRNIPDALVRMLADFVKRRADADGDEYLSLEEFKAFMLKFRRTQYDADLEAEFVFSMFDPSGTGTLNCDDVGELINTYELAELKGKPISEIVAGIEKDRDGNITVAAYKAWWRSLTFSRQPSTPSRSVHSGSDIVGAWRGFMRERKCAHQKWASKALAELDQDGDGRLAVCELRSGGFVDTIRQCFQRDIPESVIGPLVDYAVRRGDTDGSGYISLQEFEAFTWNLQRMSVDIDLEADFVFSVFDQNGEGTLNAHEFRRLFEFHSGCCSGVAASEEHVARMMSEIDGDKDGEITKAEYKQWCSAMGRASVSH